LDINDLLRVAAVIAPVILTWRIAVLIDRKVVRLETQQVKQLAEESQEECSTDYLRDKDYE
jgi:hypothetical protein